MGKCILAGHVVDIFDVNRIPLILDITLTNAGEGYVIEFPRPILYYGTIIIVGENLTVSQSRLIPYFSLCSTNVNNGINKIMNAKDNPLSRVHTQRINGIAVETDCRFTDSSPYEVYRVLTSANADMESNKMTLYGTGGDHFVSGNIKIYAK